MSKKRKNYARRVRGLLRGRKGLSLRIGLHARKRIEKRIIPEKGIKTRLRKPKNLYYAEKQYTRSPYEEKYKCYFKKSGQQHHIYVLIFNFKENYIKVATVIKDRPRMQGKFKPTYGRRRT